uniref:G-protein coupled receptors family 1 profile domain-containing protein n=1 Tax=Strigamia maritima TaxID=126957 RepID=T1J8E9_STRMM
MSCQDGLNLHLHGNSVNISSPHNFNAKWKHSYTLTILLSAIVAILSLCTILGNITVIASFARDVKLRKTRNYYILNLSICDLLVGSFMTIIALINEIYQEWQLGMPFCKFWLCVDQIVIFESVLTRLLMFWDRYLLTTQPLFYLGKQTPKRAGIKILVTWLFSIAIHCPVTILGDMFVSPPPNDTCAAHCTVYVLRNAVFAGLKALLAYILPFILMTGIGIQIYRNIHRKTLQYSARQKVIRFRDVSAQTSNSSAAPPAYHVCYYNSNSSKTNKRCTCPNRSLTAGVTQMAAVSVQYSTIPLEWWPWNAPHHQQIGNYRFCRVASPWPTCNLAECTPSVTLAPVKQRWAFARGKAFLLPNKFKTLVKFLSFVLVVYFVCWTPYVVGELLHVFCPRCVDDSVLRLMYWAVYYNSVINPFVYATTLKRFSLNFYLIWCCWRTEVWDKQSMCSDNTTKAWA